MTPKDTNAIEGKSMSLECRGKLPLKHLMETEGSTEELKWNSHISLTDVGTGPLYVGTKYSVKWFWTPKDRQIEHNFQEIENKHSGGVI